jgi:hypothetical protein
MRSRTWRSRPEVLLDFAKIRQQLARKLRELLKAILQRGVVQRRRRPFSDPRDLAIDRGAPFQQLRNARFRVRRAALGHLPQQLDQHQQPRLRADERPLRQARYPKNRFFRRRGKIEMRLIGIGHVNLPQPALFVTRPIVKVFNRSFGKTALSSPSRRWKSSSSSASTKLA